MDKFIWRVTTDTSGGGDFKVSSTEFGDGYTQDAALGLNNERQEWNVTYFSPHMSDIDAVLAFVRARRGATPFLWTPPRGVEGTYLANSYRISDHGGARQSITMTFKQVFRP